MASTVPPGIGSNVASQFAKQGINTAGSAVGGSALGGVAGAAGGKIAAAGGAIKGAGAAVAIGGGQLIADGGKAIVSTIGANTFLIIAILSRFLDAYFTGWSFGVNSYTLYIDIAMLFYAILYFKKDKIDYAIWGFIGFLAFASFLLPYLQRVLPSTISYPILMLIIAGIAIFSVYKYKDKELAIIFFIFLLEIGIPFFNMQFHDFFVANRWTVILLFWPFWATYAAKYADTKMSAILFVGMILFVLLFFKPFTFAALDEFQVENVITSDQQDQARTGWGNVKGTFSDIWASVACGWEAAVHGDQSCYDELRKQQESGQEIYDALEIYFSQYENTQTFYKNEERFEYAMNVRIKNKLYDEMKVYLSCGTSTKASEISESDEETGLIVGENPIIVKKNKLFERAILCKVDHAPDTKKPIVFYRARVKNLEGTTDFKRLIVEEKDDSKQSLYAQLTNEEFRGQDYSSKPQKGFSHMDIRIDRKGPLIEIPRGDSFILTSSIFNNAAGSVSLKSAEIYLDQGLSAECESKDASVTQSGQTIVFDSSAKPFDEIKEDNSMEFSSCKIQYNIDSGLLNQGSDVKRVYPQTYHLGGKITYDYMLTSYSRMDIRNPKTKKNTTMVVEAK